MGKVRERKTIKEKLSNWILGKGKEGLTYTALSKKKNKTNYREIQIWEQRRST